MGFKLVSKNDNLKLLIRTDQQKSPENEEVGVKLSVQYTVTIHISAY